MSKLGALHLTKHTGANHSGTIIFFHGSGSNGADLKQWVSSLAKNFSFPHIKILYPTAPLQPFSSTGGGMSNVWFDRIALLQSVPEQLASIAEIEVEVKKLIKQENDAGIPSNRIIVGGFSMGGSLSFHTGFRWDRNLAGAFVFGSFLNNNSIVYEELKKASGVQLPPLLQIHGDSDGLVDISWGQTTFNELKALGVQGEFHIIPKLGHSINPSSLLLLKEFIDKHLPEL